MFEKLFAACTPTGYCVVLSLVKDKKMLIVFNSLFDLNMVRDAMCKSANLTDLTMFLCYIEQIY